MLTAYVLTPLSTPGATSPVTLQRVKDALGVTDTSKDTELKRLIRACAVTFGGIHGMRREYARRQWRVRLGGLGGSLLLLPVWPIESVSLVAEGPDDYTTVVAAADYEVADPERQCLYRFDGWADSRIQIAGAQAASGDPLEYKVELIAGWLMPEEAPDWTATTAFAAGKRARATAPSLYTFEVTAGGGGQTGATEPTWPTTLGGTVVDGAITWTARAAQRLPDDLEEAALLTVSEWHRGSRRVPAGIQSESADGVEVAYDFVIAGRRGMNPLPPAARAVLEGYR